MKVLNLIVSLAIGTVFLFAGSTKATQMSDFVTAVASYHMLPSHGALFLALLLPSLEVLLGAALICGFWVRAAGFMTCLLALMFAVAVSTALWQGLDLDCGCFGPALSQVVQIGFSTLLIDAVLFIGGWFLAFGPDGTENTNDQPS